MHNRVPRLIVAVLPIVIPPAATAGPADRPHRDGEAVVVFQGRLRPREMSALAARAHGQAHVARTMAAVGRPHVALARFPATVPVDLMVAKLRSLPGVAYAEPNYLAHVPRLDTTQPTEALRHAVRGRDGRATRDPGSMLDPARSLDIDRPRASVYSDSNDPSYQAGWSWISADIIWPDKKPEPAIAVLDTGVDYTHPDLAGRIVKGYDWINADADPQDDNGHGTHVAGVVAAGINNQKGIAGVSGGKVVAIKVLDVNGSGTYFDIAMGLLEAAANSTVKVVNMSLGGTGASTLLQDAVQDAVDAGKLIVAAAGNESSTTPVYPAYYADPSFPTLSPQVLAVAASGLRNYYSLPYYYNDYSCRALYSNYGSWITAVAPGTSIYSTTPTKDFWMNAHESVPKNYASLSGTSMAAPHVSGTAARAFGAMPVGTTAPQVRQRLLDTGYLDVVEGAGDFVDTDGDGLTDTECWDAATNPDAASVDVAAAMYRAQVTAALLDANGALPLTGAKMSAYLGTSLRRSAVVDVAYSFSNVRVINVPMDNTTPYTFKVLKAGYTTGPQAFASILVEDGGGQPQFRTYRNLGVLGVPRNNGRYHLVTDWLIDSQELDLHVFTPSSAPLACSVGAWGACGPGSLAAAPFARWLHDGGPATGSRSTELVDLRPPLYGTASGSPYEIFVRDYDEGADVYSFGVTRIWSAGQIRATVGAINADISTNDCTLDGGSVACDTWYVGDLAGDGTFTPRNVFGVFDTPSGAPGGVLPYGSTDRQRIDSRRR